jgi:dienelactone hydrolase
LAALGYVTLVADLYGDGTRARDMAPAMELMNGLRSDAGRWRARARAALDALAGQDGVDRSRLAAIGYCFGGSTALELARSGAPLAAVVSFHGGLASPRPDDARNIKAKVLVCHGAADPGASGRSCCLRDADEQDLCRLAGHRLWQHAARLHQSGG